MIYVDELRRAPRFAPPGLRRAGQVCHMMADTDEELESMARMLGLEPAWRHGDHYDLVPSRRKRALVLGAWEISSRAMARRRRK